MGAAGGPYAGEQLLAEAPWYLKSMIGSSGNPAYQLVFGSDLVDPLGWGEKDEGPLTSSLGQERSRGKGLGWILTVRASLRSRGNCVSWGSGQHKESGQHKLEEIAGA